MLYNFQGLDMAVGDNATKANLKNRLVFSNTNLQAYIKANTTATDLDKQRSQSLSSVSPQANTTKAPNPSPIPVTFGPKGVPRIYSSSDTVPVPDILLSPGDKIEAQKIIDYINILAKTFTLHTFNFTMIQKKIPRALCPGGLNLEHMGFVPAGYPLAPYTRVSSWTDISLSAINYNHALAAGAAIKEQDFINANNAIKNLIDTNKANVVTTFEYCHSSCHCSCHGSRGRR